ncbi:MAG: putative DNA alkylation repair enzyme [Parcubacteria group bacterium Gr01-1014_31]|nr:MAG: putative DNA alkylation repair enzyme [Parcubacteria group bacterium Gr01-1014_31]
MASLAALRRRLRQQASGAKAKVLQRFFRTGPGEYGEGDIFLGVTVPQTRAVARQFTDLALADVARLLSSAIHEERLCALLILVHRFQIGDEREQYRVFQFYLRHLRRVNNWDLVDLSAVNIVGAYLVGRPTALLARLAQSRNVWERRVAIVATFAFIRAGRFRPTFTLAQVLMADRHDLIHKAVGWMLREVGKRDAAALESWLRPRYQKMPRTMLRYAIERFPPPRRRAYLAGTA